MEVKEGDKKGRKKNWLGRYLKRNKRSKLERKERKRI